MEFENQQWGYYVKNELYPYAMDYHYATENYDQKLTPYRDSKGIALPHKSGQAAKSNKFALKFLELTSLQVYADGIGNSLEEAKQLLKQEIRDTCKIFEKEWAKSG